MAQIMFSFYKRHAYVYIGLLLSSIYLMELILQLFPLIIKNLILTFCLCLFCNCCCLSGWFFCSTISSSLD